MHWVKLTDSDGDVRFVNLARVDQMLVDDESGQTVVVMGPTYSRFKEAPEQILRSAYFLPARAGGGNAETS